MRKCKKIRKSTMREVVRMRVRARASDIEVRERMGDRKRDRK